MRESAQLKGRRTLIPNPDPDFRGAKVVKGDLEFEYIVDGFNVRLSILQGFNLAVKDAGDKVVVKKVSERSE